MGQLEICLLTECWFHLISFTMPDCWRANSASNLVGYLNTRYGNEDWSPFQFLNTSRETYRGRRSGKKVLRQELLETNTITTLVTRRESQRILSCRREIDERNLIYVSSSPNSLITTPLKTTLNSHADSGSTNSSVVECIGDKQTRELTANFCLLNSRSVRNKTLILKDYVVEHDIDVLALTETWLQPDNTDDLVIKELCPTGYSFLHAPRSTGRGGGVGVLFKDSLKMKKIDKQKFHSFENIQLNLHSSTSSTVILVIYRPPSTNCSTFLEEFSNFLEQFVIASGRLLLVGDFNFHLNSTDSSTIKFQSLLNSFNLTHHIKYPTHCGGNTLDTIITRSSENMLSNISVRDTGLSDHYAVHCSLSIKKPALERKVIIFRKLQSIDRAALCEDICNSSLTLTGPAAENLNDLIIQFNTVLRDLLNKYAPQKQRLIVVRPSAPWYNEEIKLEKKKRRQLERRWRISRDLHDRKLFVAQCRKVQQLISLSKSDYYTSLISENQSDQKMLFKIVDKLLHRNEARKLPTTAPKTLVENFVNFFTDKVSIIRQGLSSQQTSHTAISDHDNPCCSVFSNFESVTSQDVEKIIRSSASKSCDLDPLPTTVLKEVLHVLLPTITKIINLSLASSTVPNKFKESLISPLLKKQSLDPEVLNNYRPVSNLPFVSKVLEKVVASQISSYLDTHGLNEIFQSAYKRHHSTETALLRVQNDILKAIDNNCSVILLMLDLSAAFDTVDHAILLHRLQSHFGITGNALKWFESYLSERHQCVYINGTKSSWHDLLFGVPQGSVLGPILFTLYTSPLGDIIRRHNLCLHMYADDTQIYLSFKPSAEGQLSCAKSTIENCLVDIKQWMASNLLKLNDDKTELLVIHGKHRPKPPLCAISVGQEIIRSSESARNIGVIVDDNLTLERQVSAICKSAFFHIRNISQIRKYLPQKTAETLVHALITSRLDNCNSLLFGLPKYQIDRLQRVQNCAARLVTGSGKYDHITPVLMNLHWLPVEKRIIFKLLLLTFKARMNLAPSYIKDLIQEYKPQRNLRSSKKCLLQEHTYNLKSYGARAFSVAAPVLWNSLPNNIKELNSIEVFKSSLKTHLFNQHFNQ